MGDNPVVGTAQHKRTDVAWVQGFDEQRKELHILRQRNRTVEAGIVRPIEEGRPIDGDLVRLTPRPEFPLLCDVEEVLQHPDRPKDPPPGHAGPPMVASEAYRRGWDAAFARPARPDDPDAN